MKKLVSALSIALLISGFTSNVLAKQKVYKWKLAMTWPSTFAPLVSPPKKFAKLVEEMSNGRLKVKVHGSEKHKSPLGVLDMVKAGNYDMAHSASYYWKGKDINTPFFTTMPFGMTYSELYSWFYYGGGLELMKKVYDKQKVYAFPGGNTGVQMGGWFKKPINSLADLKGLKMRIPGYAGEIFSKLGVLVTNIAPGELYTSLERGTIDAVEWVTPALDLKVGFQKVAQYYYTGWHEPASDTQFLINQKAYNKLPKDLQVIVKTAMKSVASDFYLEHFYMNVKALQELKTKYKDVKILSFPAEVMSAMKKANEQIVSKLEKKGGLTQEIIKSQRNYMREARQWSKVTDYSYIKSIDEIK